MAKMGRPRAGHLRGHKIRRPDRVAEQLARREEAGEAEIGHLAGRKSRKGEKESGVAQEA